MSFLSAIPFWIIVVGIVLVIFILLFRTMNQVYLLSLIKKNFFYFFLIGLIAFFVISIISLHTAHDFELSTLGGLGDAAKIYGNWFLGIFKNIGKITGYAVSQNWFGNSTG